MHQSVLRQDTSDSNLNLIGQLECRVGECQTALLRTCWHSQEAQLGAGELNGVPEQFQTPQPYRPNAFLGHLPLIG
ncbi:hypothetical protein SprV_0100472100 [Sparganum proliferum]